MVAKCMHLGLQHVNQKLIFQTLYADIEQHSGIYTLLMTGVLFSVMCVSVCCRAAGAEFSSRGMKAISLIERSGISLEFKMIVAHSRTWK